MRATFRKSAAAVGVTTAAVAMSLASFAPAAAADREIVVSERTNGELRCYTKGNSYAQQGRIHGFSCEQVYLNIWQLTGWRDY